MGWGGGGGRVGKMEGGSPAIWETLNTGGVGRTWENTPSGEIIFFFFFKKSKGNVNVLSDISVAVLMLSESNPSNGESDAKSGCGVVPTFASLSSSQKHT